MDVRVFLAALLLGSANGGHTSGRSPYWLSIGGGTTLTLTGSGFSEDQFSQFDPTLGNTVYLVNEADTIDCDVISYLSNTQKIVCSVGKKTNTQASNTYTVVVYNDGELATGSQQVQFAHWNTPLVQRINPVWSLPGALVEFSGVMRADRYKGLDVTDPTETDPDSGHVLTKVYVGYVDCEMINATSEELYGELNNEGLTCLMTSRNIGPMNGTTYVTGRGASFTDKWGMYIDSQDRLYQHHTYPGVESISPPFGSSGGRTLITVTGVGFNPTPGTTKVNVGGSECEVQDVTDNTVTCWTPAQDQTSPGPRERGLQWEFWGGEFVDISNDAQWSGLTTSHPNYTSEFVLDAKFDLEVSSPSSGKLSGYLNPAHTGEYALGVHAESSWTRIYVATDGNPDSLVFVNHWEIFNMEYGTPTYFEIRYRGDTSTEFIVYMNDFDTKFSSSQSAMAHNERHTVTLNPSMDWDTQRLTPSASPGLASLYLNGRLSDPINVTDAEQVRSAALQLVDQECQYVASDWEYFMYTGYEDEDILSGRGNIVNDVEPYCGRHSLKLQSTDPKLYSEGDRDLMVNLHDYPYICFALMGNVQDEMTVNVYWKDIWNNWRADDISFAHGVAPSTTTWTYRCHDLKNISLSSWINNYRHEGSFLRIRRAYAPKPVMDYDKVYADELTFSNENIGVVQTVPSALKSKGVLISEINVGTVEHDNITSLEVEFVSSNCVGELPLLGVTDGSADSSSWLTDLDSGTDSYSFSVSGGGVDVTRVIEANNPVGGSWDMNIMGTTISGIPASVKYYELEQMIEAALGSSGMSVTEQGNCDRRQWLIEWQDNPGRKVLTTVDDSNLVFDGSSVSLGVSRSREGKTWFAPVVADFLTVRRTEPHVSMRVNGYSAACLGDCSYAFDDSNSPTLSSADGSMESSGEHTVTIVGSGFSSSDISDYTVSVGSEECVVTAVTSTEVTCTVTYLPAGSHAVSVAMQPAGAALQPDSAVAYTVELSVTSVSPATGGTGGGYPIVVAGSGFPSNLDGWDGNTVTVGGNDCGVIDADSASVTCTVPAGAAGISDVSVMVSGETDTLAGGFTYDSSLSATIGGVSPTTSSVLGGDVLTIAGLDLGDGTGGNVMINGMECDVLTWAGTEITCTLPSNSPGQYDVFVYTGSGGYASGTATVTYTLKVTGSSSATGSVNGGTIFVIDGEGFGSDCSLLSVNIGENMVCDVTECSDSQLTCLTRLVPTNHVITNMGTYGSYGVGFAWSPKLQVVREGDSVTWSWSKKDPLSQLLHNVYQSVSATDDSYDGSGFNSGSPTSAGSMTVTFPNAGTYFFAGDYVIDTLVMSGQIHVVRPSEEVNEVTVALGGIEADYDPIGASPSATVDGCPTLLETPFDGCNSTAPSAPDADNLYFVTDLCLTPSVTAVSASATENIPGLQGMQVRTGATFTIDGFGFGTETCQTSVMIGPASCTVTSSNDNSITCVLDDVNNVVSIQAFKIAVTVANRGTACVDVNDFNNEGQITVVPVVTSFTPTQGSVAGGTSITISGTGLKAYDNQALVRLGSGTCVIESIESATIICSTQPTAESTVSLSVFATSFNIPAISDLADSSYAFSAADTPSVTDMSVSGDTITITGNLFGSDTSAVTVTLTTVAARRKKRLEESKPLETKKVKEIRFLEELDEESEDEMHVFDKDAPESRSTHRPKIRSDLFDDFDAESGFWGVFTNTKAKTFEETKRLGAWRIAGSNPRTPLDSEMPKKKARVLRQAAATTFDCTLTSVSDTSIVCEATGLPANSYDVTVNLLGLGDAEFSGTAPVLAVSPVVSGINPTEGSVNGGALLTVSGSGFTPGDVSVTLDGAACPLESETANSLSCRVPAHAAGLVTVEVISASVSTTSSTGFTYSTAQTPVVTSVVPDTGVSPGMALVISGTGLMSGSNPTVTVGGADCAVSSATDTSVTCSSPDISGGSHAVVVRESTYGDSNNDITVTYDFTVVSVTPDQGGFGGAEVVVSGLGFDPSGGSSVTVCGNPCAISDSSSSAITCVTPVMTGTDSSVACEVVVSNSDMNSASLTDGFTYEQSLTPAVTSVSPTRGGTAGGTTLTITGTGFASSGNTVSIGGSECVISSQSSTEITCVTEAHAGPGTFPVVVEVPDNGFATTDENGEFFYIDRWSSIYTWGGQPVPSAGQLVVIEEGQTVLMDESTEVLRAIIIKGGHMVFDTDAPDEIVLRAEYILIVDGGSLSIGSEEEPFMNQAVIELHGHTRSIELPMYGAKVLAVRNGTLDVHGAPIPVTWTRLASTASAGDTSITLTTPVTWQPDDRIVIASTAHRFFFNENEERTIASVTSDGLTVTLTEALEFDHISIEQTLGGQVIETRAEVGLLTRNVKIRGNINSDFVETIEACDETWAPDQFDTQSCFNGRFGEEIGSDQFGGTVFLFGKYQNQDLVQGRISYVEVTEAGQAFQLGRYPLHFHLVGNVNTSYIRGCAVHRTYNRAVTIHAADYLTIERNVVYNNMGHAIFTEDGVEQFNVIQYNLAIYTRTSSSLLNVDITPSSYWVVHPNNILRHNAAAGGTHFGYWYRLEEHPTGPSATTSVCPNHAIMGEFRNNTAHSMGRYGLWVFSMDGYFPKDGGCGGNDIVARWDDFTVWRCDRGAEVVFGGDLQFHNFVALDNENAGIEMVDVGDHFGEGVTGSGGPGVFGSLLIGHSALSSGSCGDGASGIIVPKKEVFSISDTKFVNYDTGTCSALSGCSQCKLRQGGFRAQVKGLSFENAANKVRFQWEHETIWIDADGSLSGTAENRVVPSMGILPPSCQMDVAEFSVNPEVPGSVCGGLKFLRFNVKGPSIEPDSLQGVDLIVSNNHGSTSIPYRVKRLTTEGWMGILYTGDTYRWEFDYSSQITNISYDADTRFLESGDYYYVEHEFLQSPDGFGTTSDERNSSDSIPDPVTGYHGDYYWNNDTGIMTYLVSRDQRPTRTIFDGRPTGTKRSIDFRVYRCYYTNCIQPTPPPVPTGRPDVTFRWSDPEAWSEVPVGSGGHPTEGTYGLPVEGDEIIIPPGMWMIVDTATPSLGRVYVYGAIEFEDVMDHTFEATIIYIQGGTVVAGFSEDAPFTHNLNIILRGSLDPTNPDNEDMPMPFGVPNVGWKAIGVFGQLTLHGQHSGSAWVKLGATAAAGDSVITLAESADSSWVNMEVMITTTGKEASETEIRTVTAVAGSTLTLDTPLDYEHLGESFTLSDSSATYTMAAEVGILTRNIVIEGNDYPTLQDESFGGRIIVSQLHSEGVDYVGQAQLHSVELRNMGQDGFTDTDDPRYSLAFYNLGTDDGSNYVKKCSFNKNYNTAIGLFDSNNITVEDNVIYHTVGPCIRDDSSDNTFRSNLLSVMLFPGTYNGRNEIQNLDWFGAFSLNRATDVVLEDNVVAGSEQAGYQTYGEMCEDQTLWHNNEVHGAIYGAMLWKKGFGGLVNECRRLNHFYAWRVWDTAFYMQHYSSFLLTDVTAIDCEVGVNQIIYSPPSLSHNFLDKTATTSNSVFVGATPFHTCDYQNSQATIEDFYAHVLWNSGVDGGNSGILFAIFVSGANMAPKHAFHGADGYPALHGATYVTDVTFANYNTRICGTDVALNTNEAGDDAIHPVFTSGLVFLDTPSDNFLFIQDPNLSRVNPSDCVDMDCDGHKKVVIRDMDGTFLGSADATATSVAEFEWDGDPSRGVGDYRIPVALKQNLNGTQILEAQKFPNKGIVRDGSCSRNRAWNAWQCTNLKHRMMIIESMDSDTEIRRLSPIALIANPGTNGYVDLLNGPMDRGWCFGYTCQERISTFYSIIATDYIYEMAMTSTPPQVLRFHLLHSDSSEAVLLRIFFPKTQQYDIYVDDVYIPPTNIDNSASSYQLIPPDSSNPEAFFPTLSSTVGTNYLQREEKFLHVLLRGGHMIEIKTTPMIILTTGVVIDSENFFEEDVVANVAAMLGVSEENIRVTDVIREDSRKRTGTEIATFTFDIASSPTTNLNGGSGVTSGEVLEYDDLLVKLSNVVNSFQSGSCTDCTLELTSVEVIQPVPPPEEAGEPATQEFGEVIIEGGELFSDLQQEEEAQKLNQSLAATSYQEPGGSVLEQGVPMQVVSFTQFAVQPLIAVQSTQGDIVENLGHQSDPWMIGVALTGGPNKAVLLGTNPVPYVDGIANFTDLSVNCPGNGYSLTFHVAYPDTAPELPASLGYTFRASPKSVTLTIMATPEYVNAKTPFSVDLAIVDDDTGMPIDPTQLAGQTMTGRIRVLNQKKKGKLYGPTRFRYSDGDASEFTLDRLRLGRPGKNFRYEVKVLVRPANWRLKVVSEGFVVLPEDLVIPEDAITKRITMKGIFGKAKAVRRKETLFANRLLVELMDKVGLAYWNNIRVTVNRRPFVVLDVTGSNTQVTDAIEALCTQMKRRNLKVKIRRQRFYMNNLSVNGRKYKRCNFK